ncbi:MAG TPA: VWA domain-containing protein, partial [Niabella sp.]|nr:VWA domain-containing protein [Niabella sp.]
MRRLPIYFLIDISESMVGEPIEQVQDGIATIVKELKTDPYALETVWISIIGFAGKSTVIMPLQDMI